MLTRILTALVLAPTVVALVLWGPLWGVGLFVVAAGLLAFDECVKMTAPDSPYLRGDRVAGTVAGVLALGGAALYAHPGLVLGLGAGAMLVMVAVMARFDEIEVAGRRALGLLGSLAYVGALFGVLVLFVKLEDPLGRYGLMLLFLTVFLGDSAAYFAGRALGRHLLAPRVSPKKTWEGAVGGLLGSVGGAFIARAYLLKGHTVTDAVVIGAGVAVIEQLGDLAESLLKRATGTKDSGTLLPGHGGMLDRTDGLLFAGVWVYAYLTLS